MAAVTVATSIVAMLAAAPARLGGGGAIDVSLGRIVSALLVCLLLAGVAALLLRRGGGRIDWRALADWKTAAPARRIVVIETRRISAHADICLFRCDDRDYLVLCSASQQQVLRDTPAGPAA